MCAGRGVIATLRETFLMHEVRQPATGHVRQLAALAASQRIKVRMPLPESGPRPLHVIACGFHRTVT